jgi:hypothetical protein
VMAAVQDDVAITEKKENFKLLPKRKGRKL